jgi:hypothetical protein
MDLNCFFEAIEDLSTRLYGTKDPYDNLLRLLEMTKIYIEP